ncbi:unnamed protein product [Effrenium voratum]|uniref:WD repeat-containing protein 74 n=1 Tax=Effrenium voratum TaxID=2562239 RepID=A0AA36I820_9DINO|nr:unnamed protein product [Effrenium voratum]CAJ1381820.1 unnamed protein product [Effrenium voratum]
MKFLTGDDTGLIKWVHVENQKVERFGARRKGEAVQRLCWAGPPDAPEAALGIAYASGALELRDLAGRSLSSASTSPEVKCLQACSAGLLAVSSDGTASVVSEWGQADAFSESAFQGGAAATVEQFQLQGPVATAAVDPCRPSRFAFGGLENDVKIYDLERKEVVWTAKNVRENTLCLRVPVKVNTVGWATKMCPSRSLITCGTGDGKVRVYDANAQRRPLFELLIGYLVGSGTGGWTGAVDDTKRPQICSKIAQVRGDDWALLIADTLGVIREYDLRNLPKAQAAAAPPGRKAHWKIANKELPFRRGFRGTMGAIRDMDVHCSGDAMVAVGLGRFAYVFPTKGRNMICKVYLKQKMNCVLMSSEAMKKEEKDGKQEEGEEEPPEDDKEVDEPGDEELEEDKVEEGFSDDEAEDAAAQGAKQKRRKASKGKTKKRKAT